MIAQLRKKDTSIKSIFGITENWNDIDLSNLNKLQKMILVAMIQDYRIQVGEDEKISVSKKEEVLVYLNS